MNDPLLDRITFNPHQCGGKPCIRGMRIRVLDILQYMAGGDTEESLVAEFDELERDDIRAALAYAALQVAHPVLDTSRIAAE